MREREYVIRLRLPKTLRKRWVLTAIVSVLCLSSVAIAALKTFTSGTPMSSADLNANFSAINSHTHPTSIAVTGQAYVALQTGTVVEACAACPSGAIAIGGSCRVTPFPDPMCDAANVSLVGQGVEISYGGGSAANTNRFCCRGLQNANPGKACNLGAWALCVAATPPSSGIDSQQTTRTGTAGF